MNRRAFLSGLIAAPAVIRVAPLMRIAPVPLVLAFKTPLPPVRWRLADDRELWVNEIVAAARKHMRENDLDYYQGMARCRVTNIPELPSPLS